MQTQASKKLYSPNAAAHTLELSRSKVYDLMKSGKLRFVMIDSERRIPASEIDRLTRQGTEPDQAAA